MSHNTTLFDQDDQGGRERCEHCGQYLPKEYPHRLDLGKFLALRGLADAHIAGHEWVKIRRDGAPRDASEVDGLHVLRLTWFKLAESKGKRTGLYKLTDLGWQFLAGRVRVPAWLVETHGVVRSFSSETVSVSEIKNVILDKEYWDRYARGDAA